MKEANLELVAMWAGLMLKTGLGAGITPRQIKGALKPSNVAEMLKIIEEPKGRCCYGGMKPKTSCASCAAWKEVA